MDSSSRGTYLSVHRVALEIYISRHRNLLVVMVVESFLIFIIEMEVVYSDGGTWYPETCISLGLGTSIAFLIRKEPCRKNSIVSKGQERTEFDDYNYHCIIEECKLEHVFRWIALFIFI